MQNIINIFHHLVASLSKFLFNFSTSKWLIINFEFFKILNFLQLQGTSTNNKILHPNYTFFIHVLNI
jgi:hypothetical protein